MMTCSLARRSDWGARGLLVRSGMLFSYLKTKYMDAYEEAVIQSQQAANGSLLNLKGESVRLREINSKIRLCHSELRQDVLLNLPHSEVIDNLCRLVDELDSITRKLKTEVQQQKLAIADIIDAACSTFATLLIAKQQVGDAPTPKHAIRTAREDF